MVTQTCPRRTRGPRRAPTQTNRHFPPLIVNQYLSSARFGSIWLMGWTNRNPGYLVSDLFLIATRCSNHFSSLLLTQRCMCALHRALLHISPALQICPPLPYRIYSKIYSETRHIPVALTIFQLLCPWNLQVSGLSYGYLLNPELALLF